MLSQEEKDQLAAKLGQRDDVACAFLNLGSSPADLRLVIVTKEPERAMADTAFAELVAEPMSHKLKLQLLPPEPSHELHQVFKKGELLYKHNHLLYVDMRERLGRTFVQAEMKQDKKLKLDINNPRLFFGITCGWLLVVGVILIGVYAIAGGLITWGLILGMLCLCAAIAALATFVIGEGSDFFGRLFYPRREKSKALTSLARASAGKGEYDQAISLFMENYRLYENSSALFEAADVCYLQAKRSLQALEIYRKIINLAKTLSGEQHAFALLKQGEILLEIGGNKQEAKQSFQQLLSRFPDSQYAPGARTLIERL